VLICPVKLNRLNLSLPRGIAAIIGVFFHIDGFVKPDTLDVRGEVRHTHDGQEVYDDVGAGDELNR